MIGLVLLSSLLRAQTGVNLDHFDRVDDQVTQFMETWNIPGAAVAITKDEKLVYNRGFGYADQQHSEAAQPNNLYRIASVSKPVTAIAVMKLIQEGKLSMTDTVFGKGKILDQPYYLGVITDERLYSVTVQELLEHTSGWDRTVPCDGYPHSDPAFFPTHVTAVLGEANPVGDSTLIKFSLLKGLHHEPGTSYSYSNIGYLVLGKVIEKVSGMSYENYVKSAILDPLALDDFHPGKNLLSGKQEREAEYASASSSESCYGDGIQVPYPYGTFNLEAMNAHGGWIASAADLTRLMLSVDGQNANVPDILDASTIDLMNTPGPVNSGYANGWSVNSKASWHTGSLSGTASFICRTNNGYTWAFLFNSRADNSAAFWKALDALPWACLHVMPTVPGIDLYPPDKNVSDLSVKILNPGAASLSWTNGNGNGRIILASEDPADVAFPLDGTNYKAGEKLKNGKASEAIVVYNGSGSYCTLVGLDPSKTYSFSAFEYYNNSATGHNAVYKLANRASASGSTYEAYSPETEYMKSTAP